MPEFEFYLDEESLWRAERLSGLLMEGLRMVSEERDPIMRRELFSEQRYADEAVGVPIKDVVANVEQLAHEFALARQRNIQVLCLKLTDGEIAPISMAALLGFPFLATSFALGFLELWGLYEMFLYPSLSTFLQAVTYQASHVEERLEATDVDKAEEGVWRGLKEFLSYRFAGMKKWYEWIHGIGTPTVGPGGSLQVQVSCRTPGLRIHVSPAYFINWVFFGSPTTPVTSYVLPGRYVFAGDGPMLPKFIQDAGVFCMPPTYHATLSKF
jgi:hypothetical protein